MSRVGYRTPRPRYLDLDPARFLRMHRRTLGPPLGLVVVATETDRAGRDDRGVARGTPGRVDGWIGVVEDKGTRREDQVGGRGRGGSTWPWQANAQAEGGSSGGVI